MPAGLPSASGLSVGHSCCARLCVCHACARECFVCLCFLFLFTVFFSSVFFYFLFCFCFYFSFAFTLFASRTRACRFAVCKWTLRRTLVLSRLCVCHACARERFVCLCFLFLFTVFFSSVLLFFYFAFVLFYFARSCLPVCRLQVLCSLVCLCCARDRVELVMWFCCAHIVLALMSCSHSRCARDILALVL